MSNTPNLPPYPNGLGVSSLVLGFIGLGLFFFPILGGPISVIGLVLGIIGWVAARRRTGMTHRFSVAGTAMCLLALIVNVVVAGGTSGFFYGKHFFWVGR